MVTEQGLGMLVPNAAFRAVGGERLSAGAELCARYGSQREHSLGAKRWERTQLFSSAEVREEHRFYAGRTLITRDKGNTATDIVTFVSKSPGFHTNFEKRPFHDELLT